jgi:hypothetical protein
VVWRKASILEEHITPIFRAREWAKQDTNGSKQQAEQNTQMDLQADIGLKGTVRGAGGG